MKRNSYIKILWKLTMYTSLICTMTRHCKDYSSTLQSHVTFVAM